MSDLEKQLAMLGKLAEEHGIARVQLQDGKLTEVTFYRSTLPVAGEESDDGEEEPDDGWTAAAERLATGPRKKAS